MNDKIKNYFDSHPQSNECFVTSDEFIFHRQGDASAHAGTLADKDIYPFKREQLVWLELEPEVPIGKEVARIVTENDDLNDGLNSEAEGVKSKAEEPILVEPITETAPSEEPRPVEESKEAEEAPEQQVKKIKDAKSGNKSKRG